MKFFMDLSRREKILIYILTLLLILFVYINFFRSSLLESKNIEAASYISEEDYEILLEKYDKEKSNFKSNSLILEEREGSSNNFGKNFDLEKLSQEGLYNIVSFNISNVMMEKRDDLNVFYIDKSLVISDTLESIEEFLKLITSNDELYLADISLNRLDENLFEAHIKIREYTLKEIPYTGISYKHNNNSDNPLASDEDSLLATLYGKEEKEINSASTRSSKSTNSSKTKNNEEPKKDEEIIDSENELQENLVSDLETEIEEGKAYEFIDSNNEKHNNNLKLLEKTFYFDSEFINTNLENLANISNIDQLNEKNSDDILELGFRDKLILSDFDIDISYNIYKISFELSGPKDLRGKIYFSDDSISIYSVDFVKFVDGYENIEIYLDKTYEYPLKIQSIIIEAYAWEDIFFRNLVFYED